MLRKTSRTIVLAVLLVGALAATNADLSGATDVDQAVTATLVAVGSSECLTVDHGSPGDVAVINITNTGATGSGWGALRASDATPVFNRPANDQYASVNFAANTPPNPNLAFTKIGPDNKVCYDGAVATHHVILDLAATIPASNINAIDPTRILDTRNDDQSESHQCRTDEYPVAKYAFDPEYVSDCLLYAWAEDDRDLASRFADPPVIEFLFGLGTGAGWKDLGCIDQPLQVWPYCTVDPSPVAAQSGARQITFVFTAYDDVLVVGTTL